MFNKSILSIILGLLVPAGLVYGDSLSASNLLNNRTTPQFTNSLPVLGIPEGIVRQTNMSYYSPFTFVVDKNQKTMEIWKYDKMSYKRVALFPIDMGKNEGDKKQLGDYATPEGVYFLLSRLEGKNLSFEKYGSRAFTTDYPNYFDKLAGKTGSGIWLHAVPDEVSLSRGSRGCVVVRDNVIKEVTKYVKLRKTPILINSSTKYLDQKEQKKRSKKLTTWLEKWRESWTGKKLDSYISFYHDEFKSMNMNKSQWREYKKGLNETYDYMHVQLSDPVVYGHEDHFVIRTLQRYESEKYSDFGEKILYVRKSDGDYKIIGEDWKAIKNHSVYQEFLQKQGTSYVNRTMSDPGI